ncbi:MAG: M67 family metallopeptidase [Candidatus Promineofilum sp.]|nr:M67 family metallopeptidase [Promineifilum sp.]
MLILPGPLHHQIAAHGATSYPYEGCGLLLGTAEDGRNVVQAVRPLPNVWPVASEQPERFRIAPDDWRDVELEAMSQGLDVIGIFHSHPDHPAVASPRDLAWASWPGYSYLITEVITGKPVASRSWQLAADRSGFDEETIKII